MSTLTSKSLRKLSDGTSIPVIGFGVYQTPPGEATTIVNEALKAGYRLIDSAKLYGNEEETGEGIADFLKANPSVHRSETPAGEALSIVSEALKAGYRLIDSASSYGNEEEAGEGIADFLKANLSVHRSEVYYTTKIRNEDHGYEATKAAIQKSLLKVEKLIGYIDLILVHSPISDKEKRLGTWKALQEAVALGSVKSIGVSNYGVKHLEELLAWDGLVVKPVVNQVEAHPWLPRKDIAAFAAKHDILIEAYSPITQGKKLTDPELVQVASEVSKKAGKTIGPAQVLIRWSLEQGYIPLPKTATVSRIAENLDVFDWKLTEEARKVLEKDTHEVLTWQGRDPTAYEDPK
ncbi:hypothetical protein BABINDRAFT_177289 [Babjeviella inositovora NRRL Y-12698]|uniref:2-dehydropantolactone reductase n=1 Tax=Babjeviella inositovora NRRL Y-12698 TaxID=984486 RepID=A0A1E3QLI0_9ASCO|nr:uncharacterized protein BABINDRAFT_177289 [Babjeviella inositovora NRRL Y-12698]ODQ78543.1 hypothetical protein BABINDRAFT_177289 [Babjeviella inositovora NRRL Y-12698]